MNINLTSLFQRRSSLRTLSTTTSSDNMATDQILQSVIHPSPQSAGYSRYGEYAVDHSTGVPKIEIPLYSLDTGDYSLPISLSYHAGGIRVMDVSSPVGLGWTLIAGGVITRTICAQADKFSSSYNLYFKSRADVSAALNDSGKDPDWWKNVFAGNPAYDSETDRYSYTFAGKSGIFRYIAKNGAIRTIPHDPIKIEETTDGFMITDSDGTKYYFEAAETSGPASSVMVTTAWYLTKIITAERHNTITFNYSTGQTYQVRYRSEVYEEGHYYWWDESSQEHLQDGYMTAYDSRYKWYNHSVPRLNSITWNDVTINFSYATDRLDAQKERLTAITVLDNNTQVRNISFSNSSYFGTSIKNWRLKLSSVTISGSSSIPSETYSFTYDSTTPPNHYNFNPSSDLTGQDRYSHEDYWGFYNGQNNEHQIPNGIIPGATTANRDAREAYMKMCSLESITFPTGGRTVFNMEANRIGARLVGGLRVASISSYDFDGTLLEQKSYEYSEATEQIPIIDDLFSYYDDVWYFISYTGSGHINESIDEEHFFAVSEPILPLTGWSGSPVFYGCVTEYIGGTASSNLGKTVFHYEQDTESSYPDSDEDWYALPLHMRFYSSLYNNDEGILRPLLTGSDFYRLEDSGAYTLVRREQFSYTEMTPNESASEVDGDYHFITGVRLVKRGFGFIYTDRSLSGSSAPYPDEQTFHDNIYYTNVLAYRRLRLLTGHTVTDYCTDESGNTLTMTRATSYTYDVDGTLKLRTLLPLSEAFTNSDGAEVKTEYTYTFQHSGSPYSEMATLNRVDNRITERHLYGGIQQSIKTMSYKAITSRTSTFYVPDTITETVGPDAAGTNNTRTLASFDEYDTSKACLLHYTAPQGRKYTILWGYGYRYPVALIEGLDFSVVNSVVDRLTRSLIANCTTSNASTLLSSMRSSVESLPNLSLVTTWLYQPGVGIVSETSPTGAIRSYQYDSLGRVTLMSDDQGEIETYTYSFATQASGVWVPNLVTKSIKKNASSSDTARITTSEWYDGIGRPYGSTSFKASGTSSNLLTLARYDYSGRVVRNWLPVISTAQHLTTSEFQTAANSTYGSTEGQRAFNEKTYETSGLNRVKTEFGPGAAWYPGHSVNTEWKCNSSESSSLLYCKHYSADSDNAESVTDNGSYATGMLSVAHVTDEDGNSSFSFMNKAGLVVMERRLSSASVKHDTYYVYDKRGNLRFVLQPKYQESASVPMFAFRYRYDLKNNRIWTGTPGADSRQNVFDDTGRLVYSQNGLQRASGKWTFYTYDSLSRLDTTGESSSQSTSGTIYMKYRYDDYSFCGSGGFTSSLYPTSCSWTRGKLTGMEVFVHHPSGLGISTSMQYRTLEYDSRGQVVRTVSNNPVSSSYGYNVVSTSWSHTGKPSCVTTIHASGSSLEVSVVRTYTYDHVDKLTSISQAIGGGVAMTIANYVYDSLGRLQTRKLAGSSSSLLDQTLSYDIRNEITGLSNGRFAETLNYCDITSGKGFGGSATGMNWGSGTSSVDKSYSFSFDGMDRLTSAAFSGTGSNHSEVISGYDLNGNILGISQDGGSTITMSYNGNLLVSVGGSACSYDVDGHLTSDARKGISSIIYTDSGLPMQVTFTDGSTIMYAYTADGIRLRSAHSGGATRDWCGDAVYEGGSRKLILNEEGYYDVTNNALRFFIKDHVGSVRVVVDGSGNVMESTDYYPLGGQFNASTSVQPYKFGCKEYDSYKNINTLDFGARTFDPSIGRWFTQDPMAEKYYSLSPYNYCAGNPVKFVDPNGNWIIVAIKIAGEAAIGAGISGYLAYREGNSGRELIGAIIGGAVEGGISAVAGEAIATIKASKKIIEAIKVVSESVSSATGELSKQIVSDGFEWLDWDEIESQAINGIQFGVVNLTNTNIAEWAGEFMTRINRPDKNVIKREIQKRMSNTGISTSSNKRRAEVNRRTNETVADINKSNNCVKMIYKKGLTSILNTDYKIGFYEYKENK